MAPSLFSLSTHSTSHPPHSNPPPLIVSTITLPSSATTSPSLPGTCPPSKRCAFLSFPGQNSHPSQCHLPHSTSQTLILHTDNSKPFAVDHFVSPIPQDASCPNVPSKTTLIESIRALNITVIFKPSHSPPLYEAFLFNSPHSCRFRPQLRSPLPLTQTGRPVQPLPHKSFLQKYWMYIALFLLALGSSLKHVHSVTDLHGPLVLTSNENTGPRRHAQA